MDDGPRTDVAWLGLYPDGQVAAAGASPSARFEQREAVELAFVAALQHLGGGQPARGPGPLRCAGIHRGRDRSPVA
jgi:RNA polymerase sigma-70 factor (ECF subfamily)